METGARFLLDPRRKHLPVLLSREGAAIREDFLVRAVTIAADLGAPCISTWTGANPDGLKPDACWQRLVDAFGRVLDAARQRGVGVALEPEPGMFVETVAGYHELKRRLGAPIEFGLSLDLGHLLVTREGAPEDVVLAEKSELMAVAIEDMRRGVHEHLPFGKGDLDLDAVVDALAVSGFGGVVAVELARHSHDALNQARRSREILARAGVPFGGR